MVKWKIDPAHSEVGFKVKHLMITNVKGTFKDYKVDIETENEDFLSPRVLFIAKTVSVDTGSEDRDRHLVSADFFDSQNYPDLKFESISYEQVADNEWKLRGNLTIRNITRPIELDVEYEGKMKDPWGNNKAGFTVTGKINRKDWDLNWNAVLESGGFLVSDDVKISCELQLVKDQDTASEIRSNVEEEHHVH